MSSCLDSGVDFTWSKMKPLAGERNRREVLSAKLDGFNDCVSAMSPSDLACLPPEELDKALLALIILYQSTSAGGAIDNKIEQAMDLVKSHLLFAVREEVEVLKVQIKELAEKNEQLQRENTMLRQNHGPPQGTALAQASQPQGAPMGMQQTIPQQQPTPHPQAIPQQQYTTTGGAQGQTLPPPQQGQTLPPPQGQLQGAPSISLPQQGIPQQQAAPHPQGMPQQQPTAQLQMQQPAPHLQQPTSQSIPMQQQQPQHSIPGTQQTGLSQAQHGVAPSQSQHGVAPSQQPVQHSQQQPPPPNT